MTIDSQAQHRPPLARRALAEFLGTGLLVTVVIGSGISAQRLSTDPGLQLLENSIATALGLAVLILLFAPISEAHFNPVVSLVDFALGRTSRTGLSGGELGVFVIAQLAGALCGAVLANTMFENPTTISATDRATPATFLAEIIATAGLVLLIAGLSRTGRPIPIVAAAVGAYIGAAFWFTSSTSIANPAATLGRVFTDTFTGIAPASAAPFVAAQVVGAAIGGGVAVLLFPRRAPEPAVPAVPAAPSTT